MIRIGSFRLYGAVLMMAAWAVLLSFPVAAAAVRYEPILDGIEESDHPDLVHLLKSVADTFTLQDRPPSSQALLKKRMEDDLPRLKKALASYGYFKARVAARMDEEGDPVKVRFHIQPGPAFLLSKIQVLPAGGASGAGLPGPKDIGLEVGRPYRAGDVLDAQDRILTTLGRQGHPFPKIEDRKIVADHAIGRVEITFIVSPGPEARFGQTNLEGLGTVDPDYVRRRIPWSPGQAYDGQLLHTARRQLIGTGLFSTVDVKKGQMEDGGRLPLTVSLKERKHRSVSAAVGYSTDFGPEVELGWEHRNLFGEGEKLTLSLLVNEVNQDFGAVLRSPDFLRGDQTLVIRSNISASNTDAYQNKEHDTSATVERRFSDEFMAGLGVRYRLTEVEQDGVEETYGLFSVPGTLEYDTSDDRLDPSEGGRLTVAVEPYFDTLGENVSFIKYRASYARYFELADQKKAILALRASVGRIDGATRGDIPVDERLYAGGGGSIRGYGYQYAGPLAGGDPTGGLSKIDFSGELRYRITDKFGLTAFIDGGRAYAGTEPDFDEDLFWAAGVGFRYYTSIGPIRLDVAFPLDPRPGTDDDFQIYISIGQAF